MFGGRSSKGGLMSSTSYAAIQPELRSDESVLWTGQPQRKVILRQLVTPTSLFINGIVLSYLISRAWTMWHLGYVTPMFLLLVLVAILQYALCGRIVYNAWRRDRTHYAATNKRVMVLNVGSTRKITDMYFAKLDSVSLSVRADGIGTIKFSPGPSDQANWWRRICRSAQWTDVDFSMLIFYDIKDARIVHQLIEDQRQQSLKMDSADGTT